MKAEVAFTSLCRVLFSKMALFEVTGLLCVCVFADTLSRFEPFRCPLHRICVTWSCRAFKEGYVDPV